MSKALKDIELQMGEQVWNPRLPYYYAIYQFVAGNHERAIYLLDSNLKNKPSIYLIKEITHFLEELKCIFAKDPTMSTGLGDLMDFISG